jgi:hypothetical protein
MSQSRELISTLSPEKVEKITKAIKIILDHGCGPVWAAINNKTKKVVLCFPSADGPNPNTYTFDGLEGEADFGAINELIIFLSGQPKAVN